LAFSEINRVLKPNGWFLNVFPSKWRPIEAHTDIPFGGVLSSPRYLKLCAALGIRGNLYQENFTVDQLVEANRYFLIHGVNYLSGRQIAEVLDQTFGEFEYVEDAFVDHSPGRSRHLAVPLKLLPMLRRLFRFAHTRVVLARKRSLH
jgi:SAM-dependent methyltransferase